MNKRLASSLAIATTLLTVGASGPLADWIAKVDPALKDELKPFIKIHSDLLTAEEAANPPPPVVSVDSPIAQARAANGTEPLFGPIGDRKLDLIRGESFPCWQDRKLLFQPCDDLTRWRSSTRILWR